MIMARPNHATLVVALAFVIGLLAGLSLNSSSSSPQPPLSSGATEHSKELALLQKTLDQYRAQSLKNGVFLRGSETGTTGASAAYPLQNGEEAEAEAAVQQQQQQQSKFQRQQQPTVTMLDALESMAAPLAAHKAVRLVLITSAIAGPTLNGGIARAFQSLAMHLAHRGGFKVTVLYAAHPWYGQGNLEHWQEHFAKLNINFVPLTDQNVNGKPVKYYGSKLVVRAYRVYRWLRAHEHEFDVASYHDYMGNGYFAAMARRQGLALRSMKLVVQCHSTVQWADELNYRPPRDHNSLAVYHMEERSIEWADIRVSPSRYYLNWLGSSAEGGAVNLARTGINLVQVNTMYPLPAEQRYMPTAKASGHLAFFGRLETRKGLFVFLDALDEAVTRGATPSLVSFIGPDVSVGGQKSTEIIKERSITRAWAFPYVVRSELNSAGALRYLKERNAVAVLPSLGDNSPYTVMEVAAMAISMITSDAGGGKELLQPNAHEEGIVVRAGDPMALATSLVRAMQLGLPPARLRTGLTEAVDNYARLMKAAAALPSPVSLRSPLPPRPTKRVVVGITTHNRPSSAVDAAESILKQTYPKDLLTLVIIDDASQHPRVPEALRKIAIMAREAGVHAHIVRRQTSSFVAKIRNEVLHMAAEADADFACLLDDDDLALPSMVSQYMDVAAATDADVLTDFSDNYDQTPEGQDVFSHRSLAVGDAFAHNFFINNVGKANFCVKPKAALRIGAHGTGKRSKSPFVDWAFLTRASLHGLKIEVLPEALYKYRKHSSGSIWYGMTSQRHHYNGHRKIVDDVASDLPQKFRDILLYCRFKLALPGVKGDGPI